MLSYLETRLENGLPGREAQVRMAPPGRDHMRFKHLADAAVMILLYFTDGTWKFPLIQRTIDGHVHSGQVGFPGGRLENNESPIDAAIRETSEEIGVSISINEVAGNLTSLDIPVSGFRVFPSIAVLDGEPSWNRQTSEVEYIIEASLRDLLEIAPVNKNSNPFRHPDNNSPCFPLSNHDVWGATAMILNEFSALLMQNHSK